MTIEQVLAVIRMPLGEEAILPIGGMLGREGDVGNRIVRGRKREGADQYTVALYEKDNDR